MTFLSSFDENVIRQHTLFTATNEIQSNILDNATNRTNEADVSQMTNVLADSYLMKVLSGKDGSSTSQSKNTTPGRAPKRPLVCIPCKKRFNRRSKLDQHNRLVHNTDVRYSCDECHKTFSRRDHIARHVRNGHCSKQSRQSAAATELSMKSEDNQLFAELSMLLFVNTVT